MTDRDALKAYRRLISTKLAVRSKINLLHQEGFITGNFSRLKLKLQSILN
jgi:hypothetical protein